MCSICILQMNFHDFRWFMHGGGSSMVRNFLLWPYLWPYFTHLWPYFDCFSCFNHRLTRASLRAKSFLHTLNQNIPYMYDPSLKQHKPSPLNEYVMLKSSGSRAHGKPQLKLQLSFFLMWLNHTVYDACVWIPTITVSLNQLHKLNICHKINVSTW